MGNNVLRLRSPKTITRPGLRLLEIFSAGMAAARILKPRVETVVRHRHSSSATTLFWGVIWGVREETYIKHIFSKRVSTWSPSHLEEEKEGPERRSG